MKHYSTSTRDLSLEEYVLSDYLTEAEKESEADVPVPDRLLPKWRYQQLVGKLRLSQKIGLLIWLNRENLLTLGGRERLLYLQAKASFEALEAGLKFARRLTKERKLLSDFKHQMRELNRRPQSKHFRQTGTSRIGVGYRDKGTLPPESLKARQKAQEDSFIPRSQVPEEVLQLLLKYLPSSLTEDGEWLDLFEISQASGSESFSEMKTLLRPL